MTDLFEFDFDIDEPDKQGDRPQTATTVEAWAEEQLAKKPSSSRPGPLFFDCETGPRPEEELKALYHEKTLEEFAATCDKRWKEETVAAKYAEYAASAWEEFVGKAALSATTGRVLLIGCLTNGVFDYEGGDDEAEILTGFWALIEDVIGSKDLIIGHNSHGFDLPFITRRSWILGVPVPREIRQGRYWNPLFIDTMDAWSFGAREYASLNDIGRAFGVGQKTEGFDGKDFAKFWFGTPEEHQKALDYNERDLRLTAAIAAKMGLV